MKLTRKQKVNIISSASGALLGGLIAVAAGKFIINVGITAIGVIALGGLASTIYTMAREEKIEA